MQMRQAHLPGVRRPGATRRAGDDDMSYGDQDAAVTDAALYEDKRWRIALARENFVRNAIADIRAVITNKDRWRERVEPMFAAGNEPVAAALDFGAWLVEQEAADHWIAALMWGEFHDGFLRYAFAYGEAMARRMEVMYPGVWEDHAGSRRRYS